jgi:hypothetical protein
MHWIRDFSRRHGPASERDRDNEAPREMRGELVDFVFQLASESNGQLEPRVIYEATGLMLGTGLTANPYGGYPGRVLRDLGNAEWWRVYDWISRMWLEFDRAGLTGQFRHGVNTVLAAHGLIWELDAVGRWERILPEPLSQQVTAAIGGLGKARYTPARDLFDLAVEAFNSRPRRDRDACSNAFAALESVAKIDLDMPNATFGQVLDEVRRRNSVNEHVQRLLRDVELLRHNSFGHGMTQPFPLNGAEVDFVYVVCAAGILLFAR